MRYRTVIELVCEASDKEDASNLAGEYLKGDIDFGVNMKCRTTTLTAYKVKKYAATCALTFGLFLFFLFSVTPVGSYVTSESGTSGPGFRPTSTVTPELRTDDESDIFKERWEEEQDRAVLDFLKND